MGVIDAAQLPAALEHARAGTLSERPAIDVDAAYVDIYRQAVGTVANNPPTPLRPPAPPATSQSGTGSIRG